MRTELGIPLTLKAIADYSGGRSVSSKNEYITHICTDSREVKKGDLFIAINGKRYDGEDYVEEANKKGAFILSSLYSASDIFCPDTRDALLNLASKYAQNLPYLLYRIGITGSVGKTTTKEFAKIILSEAYNTHANIGNFNNEIGMPMSILSAKENTEVLLMEMGMSSTGEISRLSKCLTPNIAIITNIGTAHIGRLGSRENIASAKLEIIDGMKNGTLIVPSDEPMISSVEKKMCFSLTDDTADFYIKQEKNSKVEIFKSGIKLCDSEFNIKGSQHLSCLLCAIAVSLAAGVSREKITSGIIKISDDNIRQKVIFINNLHFHCDFYNASRESMLSSVNEFSKSITDGKKSLVLGDILELGSMSQAIHYEVGKSISPQAINNLFLFGKEARIIGVGAAENGFPNDRIFINTDLSMPTITAVQIAVNCSPGEHILLKASRDIRLERIIDYIKKMEKQNND